MTLHILIIVLCMSIAVFLLLLEIFLLPGITLAGVGGGLFAVAGIVYAYSVAPTTGHVTLASSAAVFGGLFCWLLRTKSFQRVALKTNIDATLTSTRDIGLQVGDRGVTLSRLAPIGKARFGQTVVEAKALESLIDEQTPVTIVRIDGYNVTVQIAGEVPTPSINPQTL
ncbi:MAG: NfeD family protein [Tannerella sp.]|jgi:membrane protein implicated in regulation of membrane protease activity|nr:NfeD family protein [Tannerella sp.]